jgi:predicted lipase
MKGESGIIIEKCATLCKESYRTETMQGNDFQYVFSGETGLDCFIRSSDDTTWIVFRGTETDKLNDVCTDAITFRVKTPFLPEECKVHAGFLTQYMSGRSIIIDTIRFMKKPKVVCTGHSLGGALATLCAIDVEQTLEGDIETFCVTFGSPRVGGKHFCALFDAVIDNSFRFVDVNDPIPRVPFRAWGFKHVKGCFICDEDGFHPDINRVESSSCACISVSDHGIELYEKSVSFTHLPHHTPHPRTPHPHTPHPRTPHPQDP